MLLGSEDLRLSIIEGNEEAIWHKGFRCLANAQSWSWGRWCVVHGLVSRWLWPVGRRAPDLNSLHDIVNGGLRDDVGRALAPTRLEIDFKLVGGYLYDRDDAKGRWLIIHN